MLWRQMQAAPDSTTLRLLRELSATQKDNRHLLRQATTLATAVQLLSERLTKVERIANVAVAERARAFSDKFRMKEAVEDVEQQQQH